MGFITKEFEPYSVISGTIGIICFLLAGIVSDSFVSRDRMRTNFYSENKKERTKRNRYAFALFLLGAPNLFVALVLTFIYV